MAPKKHENPLIESTLLREGASIIRALNHKLRIKILLLLHKHTAMNVSAVYFRLKIEQSVASQHLGILRRAGLVRTERSGKEIHYSIDYDQLEKVQSLCRLIGK